MAFAESKGHLMPQGWMSSALIPKGVPHATCVAWFLAWFLLNSGSASPLFCLRNISFTRLRALVWCRFNFIPTHSFNKC